MPMWIQIPDDRRGEWETLKKKTVKPDKETAKGAGTPRDPKGRSTAAPMDMDVVLTSEEYRALVGKARRGTQPGFARLGR